jgi:hypothetical protein
MLYVTIKKDPYPLPFADEVLNTIIPFYLHRYETYSFLNGYLGYHQIS